MDEAAVLRYQENRLREKAAPTTKPSPAAPALSGFIQTWAEQRPMLAKQVHDTGIEVAAHTGTKEFDAYVEGSERSGVDA